MNATTETPVTLADIEAACRDYAAARADLATWIAAVEAEVKKLKAGYREALIAGLAQHNTLREGLLTLLKVAPAELFAKPRTHEFHGLKVGREKGRGRLVFGLETADVIKRIKDLFPDRVEGLIDTTERPNADNLKKLPADELAKLSGKIDGTDDQIVLRAVNSDVDRMIASLTGDIGTTGVAEVQS